MRAATTTGIAVVAMVLSACSGPRAPYDVGTQAAPVNLVLGAHRAVVVAPVGPISQPLPPSLAPFIPLPPLPVPSDVKPPVEVPLGPCPVVDPLAPISSPGGVLIPAAPTPATYTYRAKTTDTVGTKSASYKGNSTWKVTTGTLDTATGGYPVTVETTIENKGAKVTTKRVLLVVPKPLDADSPQLGTFGQPYGDPNSTDPNVQVVDAYNSTVGPYGLPQLPRSLPNVGRFGPAGIYLLSQSGGGATFTPTVPIPLLQTPVGNARFTGVGTDGVTAMSFTSTVTKPRTGVDACGKKVEGVEVHLSDGTIAGLTPDGKVTVVTFDETLVFGLQAGGLPLSDKGNVSANVLPGGAVAPDLIKRSFDFTINSVPKLAKAA
jgi:hypothetical protein